MTSLCWKETSNIQIFSCMAMLLLATLGKEDQHQQSKRTVNLKNNVEQYEELISESTCKDRTDILNFGSRKGQSLKEYVYKNVPPMEGMEN
ncbi:Hypothetical predicted protein [Podarcis lilfordi]|uniref:Uncharacterized protein n=1 Tax=Podarcis lilfordi TaxID=74358 RepID=A0AA35JUR4_9SAUR|nr:Hypothetical predicted protein [Podarcis lilfordi]